ncbi:MAG: hypothetical protein L3J83_06010 [Proteobacteria bacterium]|nr:hypothetical protein [Pseudomonadota bacterium]
MKQLPEKIALDKAVNGQRLYQGNVILSQMSRLTNLLARNDGEVKYSIEFSRARGLLGKAQVKVSADLPLMCSISEKEFMFPVEIDTVVGFIDDLAYEDLLDEDMEASWVKGDFIIPLEIIEDELILAVPDAPFSESHENDGSEDVVLVTNKKSNPFDVLKHIK